MTDFNAELDQFTKLKGGQKHMWLEHHRESILTFYDEFGETVTRRTFNLTEQTLHNLVNFTTSHRSYNRFSKSDKALAQVEIVRADVQELRKEIRELRQLFEYFQQSVGEQLVNKFFLPLLQAGLSIDYDLNLEKKDDPLRIDNIDFKQLTKKPENK
ncbi:hypothetical protein ACFLWI_00070 [Chloroflexota bacterium]